MKRNIPMMTYILEQTESSVSPDIYTGVKATQTSRINLVSDQDFAIFQWIVGTCMCQGIDSLGIVTNVINIVCFVHQGFKDPINVSLTGLAISDLCSLITVLWSSISLTPLFMTADLPFEPSETQYLIGGIPHATFSRVSGWITALVALERCLCITRPLKVKEIVTSRRISIIIAFIFAVHIIGVAPLYVVCRLDIKWSPQRNSTIYGLIFAENRDTVEAVSFVINGVCISFSAFLMIIICTLIIVFKLHRKSKWRKLSTANREVDNYSKRSLKISKMVVTISILFIICFSPVCISFLAMSLVPGLSITGEHRHVLLMIGWISVVLESINSSSNIFIYYQMSTNYKEAFDKMFSLVLFK